MQLEIPKEEVEAKRYSNSDKTPEVGDLVDTKSSLLGIQRVDYLGGCPSFFSNCVINKAFHLTDPERVELIQPADQR